MEQFLGVGNGLGRYAVVLLFYAGLFAVVRYARPNVEPEFRKSYWVLYFAWALSIFVGNYVFFLIGIMSFYPWLNNFIHSFIWIGGCLGFLYAGSHRRPIVEQFILFAALSFAVKMVERQVLGTWELDHFFFIKGNLPYVIGWSLVDGLYPILSVIGLRLASRFIPGLVTS